ncbi:HAD-IIB family hydrolase [Candidatus Kaiserbacteria bacterium]|nr:HAD-IIB family hydrolase [Candidatus Kaiserbacteria bacterium]
MTDTFPRAILFDLDETLAESFQPPTPAMLDRFERLLAIVPTAIITGGSYLRIEHDFLSVLRAHANLSNLFLFPNSSAECFLFKNESWGLEYSIGALTPEEKEHIIDTLLQTVAEIPDFKDAPFFGNRIIDRGVQIAYTVVGLDAPQEIKMAWDPDRSKRLRFCEVLGAKLPDFEVLVGGASTVDVTRKGMDKAYGVQWLSKRLDIPVDQMLYIGDALFPGGNDYVVIPTGIHTQIVNGPEETAKIIDELLTAAPNTPPLN